MDLTKRERVLWVAGWVLMMAAGAFGQAPPNDYFTNATVLSGTSITFTGTLAGATTEAADPQSFWQSSVWWTWTAPTSSRVVIEILRAPAANNLTNALLFVYTGDDENSLTGIPYGANSFQSPQGRYVSFMAAAGTSYKVEVAGTGTEPFSLRLTATNPPVFVCQPGDCTVSPYGSAFFSALASGLQSDATFFPRSARASYQWKRDGVPMPGETYPSLLIHYVTTNEAGAYSVVASNAGGVTESRAAILTVVETNPIPRLAAVRPVNASAISFSMRAEPGRWYKVESSQDLQTWGNPVWLQATNELISISLARLGATHFVRASLDVPTEVCVAQLKRLWWGQNLFAIEEQQSYYALVMFDQIAAYIPRDGQFITYPCPEGGIYAVITVGVLPTCSLHARGHAITGAQ